MSRKIDEPLTWKRRWTGYDYVLIAAGLVLVTVGALQVAWIYSDLQTALAAIAQEQPAR